MPVEGLHTPLTTVPPWLWAMNIIGRECVCHWDLAYTTSLLIEFCKHTSSNPLTLHSSSTNLSDIVWKTGT
jgi:hypothetical protein